MNLRDTLNLSLNGCVHEFHISDLMGLDRFCTLVCRQCNAQATAGEVAWMLAGGQLVRMQHDIETQTREKLIELANMPTVGGVN